MVLIAIVIGLMGGFSAVIFYQMIHAVQYICWGTGEPSPEYFHGLSWLHVIVIPAFGLLIVSYIITKIDPESKGHGVPGIIEAIARKGGRVRPISAITKMITAALTIGMGGSVGREGPIVQIGATLGSMMGQWLHVDERRLKTMVGCGAAAGIAGTFNAPIAGAIFALEVIVGDFCCRFFFSDCDFIRCCYGCWMALRQ